MNIRICAALTIVVFIFMVNVRADVYSSFQTKRFYSANRRHFLEVTPSKRATLYRNGRRIQPLWTRLLPQLPARLVVTDDGRSVAMIDFYYGNNHAPDAPVIIIFGEGGEEVARYALKNVADLSRTTATTSTSYWFRDVMLMQGERWLVIETVVAKYDRSKCGNAHSPEEAAKMSEICMATAPYEKLSFDMSTGKLSSRENLVSQ